MRKPHDDNSTKHINKLSSLKNLANPGFLRGETKMICFHGRKAFSHVDPIFFGGQSSESWVSRVGLRQNTNRADASSTQSSTDTQSHSRVPQFIMSTSEQALIYSLMCLLTQITMLSIFDILRLGR
ncbi:hypothetical protein RRG08_024575 [Elysia crispata]|uniref:Uncharacterized protein n=1 Tax=Elysia crispata TaxID=231223 RepID=A0AAE0ZW64_9GAST|nr:hypothetical protein RRG08_024575 [Elysia crispata]